MRELLTCHSSQENLMSRAIYSLCAALSVLVLASCGGDEPDSEMTTKEVITDVDTAVVRTETEIDVDTDVDTIQSPAIERTDPS